MFAPKAHVMHAPMVELLTAQENYELVRMAHEASLRKASARREAAMRDADAVGLSRRKIAQMTGLSHTRVNQILQPREAEAETRRAETMSELAGLSGQPLADRMLALVLSNSLSRDDIAAATGLTVDKVNTLIQEHSEHLARTRSIAAQEMVARHLPS
jgi:DNA-directed RNA polymerase specialized sigma24 family protein